MAEATHSFPQNFLWGTATSGYQYEGHSANADFWPWEQGAGHIAQGHKSGRACDWWEGRRWQADFDRAAADGHTALRMSVEWSRVEPTPARWDEDALDHYREMVKGLRARGLEPMVTLHHLVNPQWVMERNAWETGEVVALFERYVRKVVSALGEFVSLWCTINEPNVYMFAGWTVGVFPPGKKDTRLMFRMAPNILKAHAAAYHAIHARSRRRWSVCPFPSGPSSRRILVRRWMSGPRGRSSTCSAVCSPTLFARALCGSGSDTPCLFWKPKEHWITLG